MGRASWPPHGPCDAWFRVALCGVLIASSGCESLQRKFTRKSKHPKAAPTPIINFQDYTQAMTPLDRYRKHYLMFDYWNDELIESLQQKPQNPKRFRRASSEALAELEVMKGLLADAAAVRFEPVIEERTRINRQIQSGGLGSMQANVLWRTLEAQTRQIHREFFWRDAEDRLKEPSAETASASPAHENSSSSAVPSERPAQ